MIPFNFAIRRRMMAQAGGAAEGAFLSPQPGVTYVNGLTGLDASTVSAMSALISNNAEITLDASEVYVSYGNNNRKLSVADQVTIPLNGTNYAFDILGFNHDDLTDAAAYGRATATGKAGITLQMHDVYSTDYRVTQYNNNEGGWKNSEMRTSTMIDMEKCLPYDWQTIVKPINKVTGIGGMYSPSTATETVSDKCFLLSKIEIFGESGGGFYGAYTYAGEGNQYLYYKVGNSVFKYKNGSVKCWWTRSPFCGNSAGWLVIYNEGKLNRVSADSLYGVAFAFCI